MILKAHSLSVVRCWLSSITWSENWFNDSYRTVNWSENVYWSGNRVKSNNWPDQDYRSRNWNINI